MSFLEAANLIQPEPDHHNFKSKVGLVQGKLRVMFYAGKVDERHKYICQCFCGNYSIICNSNLRNNSRTNSCGCEQRKWRSNISPEKIKERISELEFKTPYKVLDAGLGTKDSKWLLECSLHGEFLSNWISVVNKGTNCPTCACKNKGFNQMIPAYFYLNSVSDLEGNLVAYKFGITNSTVNKRLKWLQLGTDYRLDNILSYKFSKGRDASNLESLFAKAFGKNFLTKDQLSVGFSETIAPDDITKYKTWLQTSIKDNSFKLF